MPTGALTIPELSNMLTAAAIMHPMIKPTTTEIFFRKTDPTSSITTIVKKADAPRPKLTGPPHAQPWGADVFEQSMYRPLLGLLMHRPEPPAQFFIPDVNNVAPTTTKTMPVTTFGKSLRIALGDRKLMAMDKIAQSIYV